MAEKLYKFLLVDPEMLEKDSEFQKYSAYEMYKSLYNKYSIALYSLEYLRQYAELQLEGYIEEKGIVKNIVDEEKIENLKREKEIDELVIDIFQRILDGEATSIDKKFASAYNEEEKKIIYEIIDLKKKNYDDIYIRYKGLISNIEIVMEVFFKSFAFNDYYECGEWKEGIFDWFILPLNYFYHNEVENNDIDEDNENYGLIIESIKLLASWTKKYKAKIKINKNKKGYLEEAGFNTDSFEDLIKFMDQYRDDGMVEKSSMQALKRLYRISMIAELGYIKSMIPSDTDFIKYSGYLSLLEKTIEEYYSHINAKYTSSLDGEEEIKKKLERARIKGLKRKKYERIIQLLKEMENNRRCALDKANKRMELYYDAKFPIEYREKINLGLYKKIFNELKRDCKDFRDYLISIRTGNEYKKRKDVLVKETKNRVYQYKELGLITINFLNTKIDKYKTAVVIIDSEMIKNVIIDSGKSAWSLRDGLECNHDEYRMYTKTKTMTPDKIATNAGKTDLLELIYRYNEDEEVLKEEIKEEIKNNCSYYTTSHKFDLRLTNIKKYKDKPKKEKMDRECLYYGGKLRIEDIGELVEENTVCKNNGENINDAAILYFDNVEAFKSFLDNMN